MLSDEYSFTKGIDYASLVATSEKATWTVDSVFADRRFDPSKQIIPTSWIGTSSLTFLNVSEQRTLNHIRAFSYVHLFNGYEQFIPIHLMEIAQTNWHGERAQLRALMRFGEEELKHQQLFLRAEAVLELSCECHFERYFAPESGRLEIFTAAFLAHPTLSRLLLLTAFELGSQRHYTDSVRDKQGSNSDPLYVDILKSHWIEENQHTKTDLLEIAKLASKASPEELLEAFKHVQALGAIVDESLLGQVECELKSFENMTGRILDTKQKETLRNTLCESMRYIWTEMSLTHPKFKKLALALSVPGAAELGIT